MAKKKDDFERYLTKQLKNQKFKEEYEKLAPLYDLIKLEIELRTKKNLSQADLVKKMRTS